MLTEKDRREKKGEGYLTGRLGSFDELFHALMRHFYRLVIGFVPVWRLVFVVANDKMGARLARKTFYNSWLFGSSTISWRLLRCAAAIFVAAGFVSSAASATDIMTVALSADNGLQRGSVLRPDVVGTSKIDGAVLTDADGGVQWLHCPTSDVADFACLLAANDATAPASSRVFRERPPAATGEAAQAAITLARQLFILPGWIFGDSLPHPENVSSLNPVLSPGYFKQNPVWSYLLPIIHLDDSARLSYENAITNEQAENYAAILLIYLCICVFFIIFIKIIFFEIR